VACKCTAAATIRSTTSTHTMGDTAAAGRRRVLGVGGGDEEEREARRASRSIAEIPTVSSCRMDFFRGHAGRRGGMPSPRQWQGARARRRASRLEDGVAAGPRWRVVRGRAPQSYSSSHDDTSCIFFWHVLADNTVDDGLVDGRVGRGRRPPGHHHRRLTRKLGPHCGARRSDEPPTAFFFVGRARGAAPRARAPEHPPAGGHPGPLCRAHGLRGASADAGAPSGGSSSVLVRAWDR